MFKKKKKNFEISEKLNLEDNKVIMGKALMKRLNLNIGDKFNFVIFEKQVSRRGFERYKSVITFCTILVRISYFRKTKFVGMCRMFDLPFKLYFLARGLAYFGF